MIAERELALLGQNKAPFEPEVRFPHGVPCFLCFGPAFPFAGKKGEYEIELQYRTKRRWQAYKVFSAHNSVPKLHYRIDLPSGEYVFKARFRGNKKMSAWSEESETVIVG